MRLTITLMTGLLLVNLYHSTMNIDIIDHNCNHETGLWLDEERSFHRLIGTVEATRIWNPLPCKR
jgi:hypothetical protein